MQDFSLLTYIVAAYFEFMVRVAFLLLFMVPVVLALNTGKKSWLFLYLLFPLVGGIMHYLIF